MPTVRESVFVWSDEKSVFQAHCPRVGSLKESAFRLSMSSLVIMCEVAFGLLKTVQIRSSTSMVRNSRVTLTMCFQCVEMDTSYLSLTVENMNAEMDDFSACSEVSQ